MTTRPISQIIADLKATCAPGSDVGILCREYESMCREYCQMDESNDYANNYIGDLQKEVQELKRDLQLATHNAASTWHSAVEFKEQLKLANIRISELDRLLQSASDHCNQTALQRNEVQSKLSACMRVANERQEELKLVTEALRWALENAVKYYPISNVFLRNARIQIEPPTHLRASIESVMGEQR